MLFIYISDVFFSYLTDFSYLILERNCRMLLNTVKTGQKNTSLLYKAYQNKSNR
jgi:hypothetical protein